MSQDALLQCQADAYPSNLTYEWMKQGQNVYHIEWVFVDVMSLQWCQYLHLEHFFLLEFKANKNSSPVIDQSLSVVLGSVTFK